MATAPGAAPGASYKAAGSAATAGAVAASGSGSGYGDEGARGYGDSQSDEQRKVGGRHSCWGSARKQGVLGSLLDIRSRCFAHVFLMCCRGAGCCQHA